jgi:very-short-patch-repair endonuclease
MKYYAIGHNCLHCHRHIDGNVFNFSTRKYKYPLCIPCQEWIEAKQIKTPPEAIQLYLALKLRGVTAELEKFDGYKSIDIAVVDAKINIEVDDPNRNYNHEPALADLRRALFSFQKGYLTLRIPNTLIGENPDETADAIADFLKLSKLKILKAI